MRGVIRPAFRLPQVIARFVIEQPAEVNQPVPFKLRFEIN
jgi:hypothetical protein